MDPAMHVVESAMVATPSSTPSSLWGTQQHWLPAHCLTHCTVPYLTHCIVSCLTHSLHIVSLTALSHISLTELSHVYCLQGNNFTQLVGSTYAGWTVGTRAVGTELITLHIMLSHQAGAEDTLQRRLFAAADPTGANYGQHMTFDELNLLMRPAAEATQRVKEWLHGVAGLQADLSVNAAGDIMEITVPVKVAEELLGSAYHLLHPTSTNGLPILRTATYQIPVQLSQYIDTIGPTTRLPHAQQQLRRASSVASAYTSPVGLREQYGATGVKAKSSNSSFAVCGFLDQYFGISSISRLVLTNRLIICFRSEGCQLLLQELRQAVSGQEGEWHFVHVQYMYTCFKMTV